MQKLEPIFTTYSIMSSSPIDQALLENGMPHQCGICGKVFVSTKGLQQHSIIHTDRKPFNCEICGKPFRFKSNLFEHRSIHTGDQPYTCPFCAKTCRLKGNLKKHLKTHVKEPEELDRAYEAVTGCPVEALEDELEGGEYDDSYDGENTPFKRRPFQRPPNSVAGVMGRRASRGSRSHILGQRQYNEEEGYPLVCVKSISDYPPLHEMLSNDISMADFARAALNISVERYECRLCELLFSSRGEMRYHAETSHNKGMTTSDAMSTGMVWCDVCLRSFDDPLLAEQHANCHRRLRLLEESGQLHLKDYLASAGV